MSKEGQMSAAGDHEAIVQGFVKETKEADFESKNAEAALKRLTEDGLTLIESISGSNMEPGEKLRLFEAVQAALDDLKDRIKTAREKVEG